MFYVSCVLACRFVKIEHFNRYSAKRFKRRNYKVPGGGESNRPVTIRCLSQLKIIPRKEGNRPLPKKENILWN